MAAPRFNERPGIGLGQPLPPSRPEHGARRSARGNDSWTRICRYNRVVRLHRTMVDEGEVVPRRREFKGVARQQRAGTLGASGNREYPAVPNRSGGTPVFGAGCLERGAQRNRVAVLGHRLQIPAPADSPAVKSRPRPRRRCLRTRPAPPAFRPCPACHPGNSGYGASVDDEHAQPLRPVPPRGRALSPALPRPRFHGEGEEQMTEI